MKVIIKKTGEVKEVSMGHGVNFLLPKGLAVMATKARIAKLKKKQDKKKQEETEKKQEHRQLAERIDGKVVTIEVKAGKAGKIHGSISKKELAKELEVLKTQIMLEKPIKKVGEYEIELKFGKVKAKVKIKVKAKK